jgi:BlaI family transcriptional regulator, penicillinase repressor
MAGSTRRVASGHTSRRQAADEIRLDSWRGRCNFDGVSKSQRLDAPTRLSRREREIIDVLHQLGRATVADVHARIPDPPSKTAIRSLLWLLEGKGHVQHEQEGPQNVYTTTVPTADARPSAVRHFLDTFFGGSRTDAALAILGGRETKLEDADIERIEDLLARHKKRSRKK